MGELVSILMRGGCEVRVEGGFTSCGMQDNEEVMVIGTEDKGKRREKDMHIQLLRSPLADYTNTLVGGGDGELVRRHDRNKGH